MNDTTPAINPTPYDPAQFHPAQFHTDVTHTAVVQLPWHHNPQLYFALALILFAVEMLIFLSNYPRRLETE